MNQSPRLYELKTDTDVNLIQKHENENDQINFNVGKMNFKQNIKLYDPHHHYKGE